MIVAYGLLAACWLLRSLGSADRDRSRAVRGQAVDARTPVRSERSMTWQREIVEASNGPGDAIALRMSGDEAPPTWGADSVSIRIGNVMFDE